MFYCKIIALSTKIIRQKKRLPKRPLVSLTNNCDCSLMDRSSLTILHCVSICRFKEEKTSYNTIKQMFCLFSLSDKTLIKILHVSKHWLKYVSIFVHFFSSVQLSIVAMFVYVFSVVKNFISNVQSFLWCEASVVVYRAGCGSRVCSVWKGAVRTGTHMQCLRIHLPPGHAPVFWKRKLMMD